MANIKRCCCFSTRQGCYLSAFYTLILCTLVVMIASVNIHSPPQNNDLFILTLLTLISSAFSIIASILLIVGVSGENEILLLPWIAATCSLTILEIVDIIYNFISYKLDYSTIGMVFSDLFIVFVNTLGLVCVSSQFVRFKRSKELKSSFQIQKYIKEKKRLDDENGFLPKATEKMTTNFSPVLLSIPETTETITYHCLQDHL